MARKLAQTHLRPNREPSFTTLEAEWRTWYLSETVRRTLFLVNVINILSCRDSKQNSYFYEALDDALLLELPLPAPDRLWKANSAQEWVQARAAAGGHDIGPRLREAMDWVGDDDGGPADHRLGNSGRLRDARTERIESRNLPEFTRVILAALRTTNDL